LELLSSILELPPSGHRCGFFHIELHAIFSLSLQKEYWHFHSRDHHFLAWKQGNVHFGCVNIEGSDLISVELAACEQ